MQQTTAVVAAIAVVAATAVAAAMAVVAAIVVVQILCVWLLASAQVPSSQPSFSSAASKHKHVHHHVEDQIYNLP